MRFDSCYRFGGSAVAVLALVGSAAAWHPAGAQERLPLRHYVSLEAYAAGINADQGEGEDTRILPGVGGRLWISGNSFGIPHTAIAGFVTYVPKKDQLSAVHYGGELDILSRGQPMGDAVSPFVSIGAGVFHTMKEITLRTSSGLGPVGVKTTKFALSPGIGLRMPYRDGLLLRADVRDVIVFKGRDGFVPSGQERTTNNVQLTLGIGLTF